MQLTSLPAPPNENPNVSGVLPDGRPGVRQLWNWQANCQAGQEYLTICSGWATTFWQEVHDATESFSNLASYEIIPSSPPNLNMFPAHPDLKPFTAQQFRLEVWSRYNSKSRYHNYDADYTDPPASPQDPGAWLRRRQADLSGPFWGPGDPQSADDGTGCGYADRCNYWFTQVLGGTPPPLWDNDPTP
jgi:hypothetical protein